MLSANYKTAIGIIRKTRLLLSDHGINNEDWLIKRTKSLGASETYGIKGNSNKNKNKIIRQKSGIPEPDDVFIGNRCTELGHILEGITADIYMHIFNKEGNLACYEVTGLVHPEYPFIGCSLDRLIIDKKNKNAYLLEIKSATRKELVVAKSKSKPPIDQNYVNQVHQQMFVTNIDKGVLFHVFFNMFKDEIPLEEQFNQAEYCGILLERIKIGDEQHDQTVKEKIDDNVIFGAESFFHKDDLSFEEFQHYYEQGKKYIEENEGYQLIAWYVKKNNIWDFPFEKTDEWEKQMIPILTDIWNRVESIKQNPANYKDFLFEEKKNPLFLDEE